MSRAVLVIVLVLTGFAAALPRGSTREDRQKRIVVNTPSPPNNCTLIQCDIPQCETRIIYPDPSSGKCCPYCAEPSPCDSTECPKGQACRIFSRTGEAYCDPDCSLDNGGCGDDQQCIQALALCSENATSPCPGFVTCIDEDPNSCPGNSQPVNCFVNPCDVTSCPNHSNATCQANYCGGCNALFFDANGTEVTKTCRSNDQPDCTAVLCLRPDCDDPLPPPPGQCCSTCPPKGGQEFCDYSPDEGPCDGYNEKYFYNSTSQACEQFIYGGCEGNKNRFSTEEDCEKKCANNQSMVDCSTVRCSAAFCPNPIRADPSKGICCDFCPEGSPSCLIDGQFYQDCGSACAATCSNPFPICILLCSSGCHCPFGQVIDEKSSSCVPLDECPVDCNTVDCAVPSCPDPIPADPENGICCSVCPENSTCPIAGQMFAECGSSCPATCANPDATCIELCSAGCHCPAGLVIDEENGSCVPLDKCPGKDDNKTSICLLPVETGNCRARINRYYFNSGSGECESFIYGGCQGNENNFQTLKECQQQCKSPEPTKQPNCNAVLCATPTCPDPIPANPVEGKCCSVCRPGSSCPVKGQIYSQCKGCPLTCTNREQPPPCPLICAPGCTCPQGQVIDVKSNACVLPKKCPGPCEKDPEVGLCKAAFPRYFYNFTSKQCEHFVYGGCGGNDNNFETLASCEQMCSECAPTCTPEFCNKNLKAKCSIPFEQREEKDGSTCFGDCDETVCSACYYSNRTISFPSLDEDCPELCPVDAKGEIFGMTCLREWGRCVRNAHRKIYGKPSKELKKPENYKCWRPRCPQF